MVKSVSQAHKAGKFAAAAADSYGKQLHDFLRRRVRRAEDMDDLAQEVYLRLLRIKAPDTVRNPLAYIYGVASHVVSEFNMRDLKGHVVFDSQVADITLEAQEAETRHGSPEDAGYLRRNVNEALQQLSDTHMAVLLLERRDGLSHGEIAERLGLSVHTVKKYVVQALAQVRASLER